MPPKTPPTTHLTRYTSFATHMTAQLNTNCNFTQHSTTLSWIIFQCYYIHMSLQVASCVSWVAWVVWAAFSCFDTAHEDWAQKSNVTVLTLCQRAKKQNNVPCLRVSSGTWRHKLASWAVSKQLQAAHTTHTTCKSYATHSGTVT